jgi:glucans biosynthesis protein
VEILTDWGPGHVELVQIPTKNEYNDNMVAFWVPEKSPEAGNVLNFAYRLHWHAAKDRAVPLLGYVTGTRIVREEKIFRFIVDYQGKALNAIPSDKQLDVEINISKGYKIHNRQLYKNVVTNGWRLVFQIQIDAGTLINDSLPETRPSCELQAIIKDKGKVLTETWTYTLVP